MRLEPTGMELMLSKSGAPFPPHEDTRKSLLLHVASAPPLFLLPSPPVLAPIPWIIAVFLCQHLQLSRSHAFSLLLGKTTTLKSISINWM